MTVTMTAPSTPRRRHRAAPTPQPPAPAGPGRARRAAAAARAARRRRRGTRVGAVVGVHDGRDRLPLGGASRCCSSARSRSTARRTCSTTSSATCSPAPTAPVGPVVPVGDPVALLDDPEHRARAGRGRGHRVRRHAGRPRPPARHPAARAGRHLGRLRPRGDVRRPVRRHRPSCGAGDKIEVVDGAGRKVFKVIGVRRAGDPLPQPAPEGAARLTLVTAEGSGRLGAIAPDGRLRRRRRRRRRSPHRPAGPRRYPSPSWRWAGQRRTAAACAVPGPAPGADPRGRRRPSAMVDGARVGGRMPARARAVLGHHRRGDAAAAQPDLTSDIAVSGRRASTTAPPHGPTPHHHHRKRTQMSVRKILAALVATASPAPSLALSAGPASAAYTSTPTTPRSPRSPPTSSASAPTPASTRSSSCADAWNSGAPRRRPRLDVATLRRHRRRHRSPLPDRSAINRPNGSGAGKAHAVRRRQQPRRRLRPLLVGAERRRDPGRPAVVPVRARHPGDGGRRNNGRRRTPRPR